MGIGDLLSALGSLTDVMKAVTSSLPGAGPAPGSAAAARATGGSSAPALAGVGVAAAGLTSITASLARIGSASGAAFSGLNASLTGIVASGAPTVFATLTQSTTLLTAKVATALTPAFTALSARIQDLAHWLDTIDAGTKRQIGTWAAWATGGLAAVAVLGKLTSAAAAVLPVLSALAASPIGLIAVGLGALAAAAPQAFSPLIEAGKGLLPVLSGALEAVGSLAASLAGALVPAISIAADLLGGLVSILDGVGEIFGVSGGAVLAFTVAAYALGGGVQSAIGRLAALATTTSLTSVAMRVCAAAAATLKAALISTGLGAVVVGLGIAISWLTGVGKAADVAEAKVKGMKGSLASQLQGGIVSGNIDKVLADSDMRARVHAARHLSPEAGKKYINATSAEHRLAILAEAGQGATGAKKEALRRAALAEHLGDGKRKLPHAAALPKEGGTSQIAAADVRRTAQSAGLGKSPLELETLQENRKQTALANEQLRETQETKAKIQKLIDKM